MGFDASTGALAGLIGAAALSLFSGVAGATVGMISAPNGPVTMLLAASLASVAAQGVQGQDILLALIAIMLSDRALQFLLGITGSGQLVKFIPYPVVAGLVTGIGVLMVASQLRALSGEEAKSDGLGLGRQVPASRHSVPLCASSLRPESFPRVPAIISGLVLGVVVFHLIMLRRSGASPGVLAWSAPYRV